MGRSFRNLSRQSAGSSPVPPGGKFSSNIAHNPFAGHLKLFQAGRRFCLSLPPFSGDTMSGYSDPGFDTLALHAGATPDA
ncbi:hypothetical protein, partial [Polaromonas sp.]|uniref:hypothetical protein n=1 Tax=Polaromonas sp. TaxID=1869339 RepID=UPI00272F6855